MKGLFLLAAGGAIAMVVVACNALSGAGGLSVCEGAECTALEHGPGSPPGDDSGNGSVDGGIDEDARVDGGVDANLPASCTGDEKICSGNVAAHCVNGRFETTTCAETCVSGDCAPYPSCRNASGNACGPMGGAGNCCESIAVPGGSFNRNNDATKAATVSGFKLDKLEVTVARFRAFVDSGGGTLAMPPATNAGAHPKIAGSGWNADWNVAAKNLLPADTNALKALLATGTFTATPGANETKPIVSVSWFMAFAFCAWDGGRLPTYAEWNYAAAGGGEQRVYPWVGNVVDEAHANFDCDFSGPGYNCTSYTYCSTDTAMEPCDAAACAALVNPGTCQTGSRCSGCATFPAEIAPVGRFASGAGKWGHLDLAGNVDEFVLDSSGERNQAVFTTPCDDCAKLVPGTPEGASQSSIDDAYLFIRGGSWNTLDTVIPLRNSSFDTVNYATRLPSLGFRCARD